MQRGVIFFSRNFNADFSGFYAGFCGLMRVLEGNMQVLLVFMRVLKGLCGF